MRMLLACFLLLVSGIAQAITVNGACPVTAGTLTLTVTQPRASCISPCLVFFDATTTTDSATLGGANNTFQDVSYTWNFGDTLASGTSTWLYGSRPGVNSRNVATGAIAAHLYISTSRDTKYTATVTATDGTNTAICGIGVTAFNASGSNGFPTTATTCVSASGTPVAGSGGCPAGAAVLNTAAVGTAISGSLSGKRVLFKCGDTFTGDNVTLSGTTWSVGAYGGCESTKTNRPIYNDTSTNYHFLVSPTAVDGRVADMDFQSSSVTATGGVGQNGGLSNTPQQITLFNLNSTGTKNAYWWSQGTQYALIDSVALASSSSIVIFINYNENNCTNGNITFNCGGTPIFNNVQYQAMMGSDSEGVFGTGCC